MVLTASYLEGPEDSTSGDDRQNNLVTHAADFEGGC